MKVLKFGGTSVGSVERMKTVAELIRGREDVVVLSAMSGTTNALMVICRQLRTGAQEEAKEGIKQLGGHYEGLAGELLKKEEFREETIKKIREIFGEIEACTRGRFLAALEKVVVAQGEILSTTLLHQYLREQGEAASLLPALDFMRIDLNGEPDGRLIREGLRAALKGVPAGSLVITQGFICRNAGGEIDNLKRGGSDYTASLIGAALGAEEIQIWTDIDGMHNNDPRYVEHTSPVRTLRFEEAAELAYFGAKILHPTCILPAERAGIPVRLLNTMDHTAPGTLISEVSEKGKIKAIAAKDDITAIKIKSSRMLLATGFLRKIFEIFESYRTPVDLITTSEVAVSVTIDNASRLKEIVMDLEELGTVTVDREMTIICVVGDFGWDNVGFEARILEAFRYIPIRMISFGGSDHNVSLLIKSEDKEPALQALSKHLFGEY
ncbi:MAG: aspartate kinase [Tannerellaceae bacterium]|jgi:aspartate kinase|nr:aspartate kinase [Tannerellaceae bacterium]